MSYVTDTILTFGLLEDERAAIDAVSGAIPGVQCFVLTSSHDPEHAVSGGSKGLQMHIAMAAFNHIGDEYLIAAVRAYEWYDPDRVRMFVNRENDECGFSELEWRP